MIERSVILCESEVLSIDEFWLPSEATPTLPAARERRCVLPFPLPESRSAESCPSNDGTLQEIEREAILRALRSAKWMVGGANGAARILGLKRTTLQGRMRKLGIKRPRSLDPQPLLQTVRRREGMSC